MMPIAGILASKFDPRVIIAIGFALTSFGLFHVSTSISASASAPW